MQVAVFIDGDQLVGGGGAQDGDLDLVSDGSHGDVAGGEVRADRCDDVMYFHQVLESGNRVSGFALAVHGDQLQHLAVQNTAGVIDFLGGQFSAILSGGAPQSSSAGQVGNIADLDRITGCSGSFGGICGFAAGRLVAASDQGKCHQKRKKKCRYSFHRVFLLEVVTALNREGC